MELRVTKEESFITQEEELEKRPKKRCCCFGRKGSYEDDDYPSTVSISFGEEDQKTSYNIKDKPKWQKSFIEELLLLKEDMDLNWISKTLKYLLEKNGPILIEKADNNYDFESRSSTKIAVEELGRRMTSIIFNQAKDEEIVNRQLSKKVEDGRIKVALTIRNYSNTIRIPSKSTIGGTWKEDSGRLTKKTLSGNSLLNSQFSTQTLDVGNGDLGESYISSYFDYKEIVEKKIFNFLHQGDDFTLSDEEKKILEGYDKKISELYKRVLADFSNKNSFFFKLTKKFLQAIYNSYVDEIEKRGNALDNLTEKIKFYACLLSMSLFNMFNSSKLLPKCRLYAPEEIFTPVIFYFIFSMKTIFNDKEKIKKKSLEDKMLLNSLGNIFNLNSVIKNHIYETEMQEKIIPFKSGKLEIKKNIQKTLSMLPALLQLNDSSIDLMNSIIEGNVKKPENLVKVQLMAKKIEPSSKQPYSQTMRAFRKVAIAESPYEKIYYLVNGINLITQGIDEFYQQHGIEAGFAITAEELFPIVIYLLTISEIETLVPDILMINLFMTNSMSMAEPGFCLNTTLAAHEFISGFAVKNDVIVEGKSSFSNYSYLRSWREFYLHL